MLQVTKIIVFIRGKRGAVEGYRTEKAHSPKRKRARRFVTVIAPGLIIQLKIIARRCQEIVLGTYTVGLSLVPPVLKVAVSVQTIS